ncbi:MAG: peptidylprolyl isomerase [Bacteroidales bacterium]|nr:peptidylprolyl isomerase [Bacteroidales bacterium]
MRKSALILAISLLVPALVVSQESDPTIMTINGKEIKKSEFEYIYNKNKQQQLEQKRLDEYLEMFKDYKLKVMEAEANGIDTTQAFISELQGYRNQLAQPYLVDQEADEKLAQEAYARLRENVEVAHILFSVEEGNPNKTQAKAYEKAMAVKKRIDAGADFTEMAKKYSEDPSVARNNGYLGYIKGFMTVYPFEQVAYTTPVGEVSEPVLSRFGYHLIKVMSRRTDPGEVLTAHIMVMLPTSITPDEAKAKEAKIQEAYQKLLNGAAFEDMVQEYTEDPGTRDTDGKMRWISTGRIVKEYEDVAFSLNEGEISAPFKTPFGWHIVKVIEKRGLKPYAEMQKDIMRRIAREDRAGNGKESLIAKLKIDYNYKFNGDKMAQLKELAKSTQLNDNFQSAISHDNETLFTLNGIKYTVSNFAEYYANSKKPKETDIEKSITKSVDDYINYAIIAYENSILEDKYPDFRNLYNEYRDGMLLFEISNREVWDKAAKDEKGLKKYFKKNRRQYSWNEPHFKGIVVQCKNDSVASEAKAMLKNLEYEESATTLNKELNRGSERVIKVKRGLFSYGDNAIVDSYFFGAKPYIDETFPVSFAKGRLLKKGPENYTDVKGQVTSDYQQQLEKDWIKYLNKKYKVDINYNVVSTIEEKK